MEEVEGEGEVYVNVESSTDRSVLVPVINGIQSRNMDTSRRLILAVDNLKTAVKYKRLVWCFI